MSDWLLPYLALDTIPPHPPKFTLLVINLQFLPQTFQGSNTRQPSKNRVHFKVPKVETH